MELSSLEVKLGITGVDTVVAGLNRVTAAMGQTGSAAKTMAASMQNINIPMVKIAQTATKMAFSLTGLYLAARVFRVIAGAIGEAYQEAQSFAKEILNIRDLSGGTMKESVQVAATFKAFGLTDQQGQREILNIAKNLGTQKGAGAVASLGIKVDPGGDGLKTFFKVMDALSHTRAGFERTQAAVKIFGAKAVIALEPMLRGTQHQTEAIAALTAAFNASALPAMEEFQVSVNLLGETILMRLVMPLITKLIPALEWMVDRVSDLVGWLGWLADTTFGISLLSAAFTVLAGVLTLVALRYAALGAKILFAAAAQAVLDALSGNWIPLAVGATVAAGVGIGFGASSVAAHNREEDLKDDATADAVRDLHKTVREIHGTMIGGGERAHRVQSELQNEINLQHTIYGRAG